MDITIRHVGFQAELGLYERVRTAAKADNRSVASWLRQAVLDRLAAERDASAEVLNDAPCPAPHAAAGTRRGSA